MVDITYLNSNVTDDRNFHILDLTDTLLQSIMTVTQRRGVLVKKECID